MVAPAAGLATAFLTAGAPPRALVGAAPRPRTEPVPRVAGEALTGALLRVALV